MSVINHDENARRANAERDAVVRAGIRTRIGYALEFLDEIDRNGPKRAEAEVKLRALCSRKWWWA